MNDDSQPVNPEDKSDLTPHQMSAAENIAALLTNALDPQNGPGLWAASLTHDELADASAVMASLIIMMWRAHGNNPRRMIGALVAANMKRSL